jgi:periplasmic copper chaperone A
MIPRRAVIASLALAGLFLSTPVHAQSASTDNLEISGGFARASAGMAMAGAGFMTITSRGEPDRLLAFSSPACTRPELHTHINDNGVMRMREVEAIDIPAGGQAELKPGGLHLMMIDLTGQLVEGETVEVTLVFEQAGDVTLTLPIKGPGATN